MNAAAFLSVFPRQLRFWTFHCMLNALPSFCIALTKTELGKSPSALGAVFSGIGTFIFLYATLTSLRGPLATETHLLSRSLKLGAIVRAWMAVFSLFALGANEENSMLYAPDYYCDLVALIAASYATIPGFSMKDLAYGIPDPSFFLIYVTTIFTGLILSFLLLMISFFAVILLQARDRMKFFALADSR